MKSCLFFSSLLSMYSSPFPNMYGPRYLCSESCLACNLKSPPMITISGSACLAIWSVSFCQYLALISMCSGPWCGANVKYMYVGAVSVLSLTLINLSLIW